MNDVTNEAMLPVMLVTVVEARVDEPETVRFVAFSVPTLLVEALVVVAKIVVR